MKSDVKLEVNSKDRVHVAHANDPSADSGKAAKSWPRSATGLAKL